MPEIPHEHSLDTSLFLTATQKVVEREYDYIVKKVGQETFLRDIDQRKMARTAIGIFERATVGSFDGDEDSYFESDAAMDISSSDMASREHMRLLSDEIGLINGYRLTLITDNKAIFDQIVRTKDECLMVISLEASLTPLGIIVEKDRHIALHGRPVMKDVLEVGPEDIAIIDQFIQKIIERE